jgi:phage baseplate assembly protein W
MTQGLYRGYSSYNYQTNKTFQVTDIDLVNTDLLNHIFTVRGSRPGMRGFGTRIPTLTFAAITSDTIDIIKEDLVQVFTFDPRVQLMDLSIVSSPDSNTIAVTAYLLYIELDMMGYLPLHLVFESGSSS